MEGFILFIDVLQFVAIPIMLIQALISFVKNRANKYQWICSLSYALTFFYLASINSNSNWLFYAGWLLMLFSFFLNHIADRYKVGVNVFDSADTSKKRAKLYQITLYSIPTVILLFISLYFILPQNY